MPLGTTMPLSVALVVVTGPAACVWANGGAPCGRACGSIQNNAATATTGQMTMNSRVRLKLLI